jgi:hypothetical protein
MRSFGGRIINRSTVVLYGPKIPPKRIDYYKASKRKAEHIRLLKKKRRRKRRT